MSDATIERALPAFAAEPLTLFQKTILQRFRRGEDTKVIADALNLKEADVANRLTPARAIEHARIAAGVAP